MIERTPIGLYIHVPFCLSKCPYCDFYSLPYEEALAGRYTRAVCRAVKDWGARLGVPADTLYFGGGTPSLLGGEGLTAILDAAAAAFGLHGAEITLEANPADALEDTLRAFRAAGGNRLSLGMQSAAEEELRFLGRRHTFAQLEAAVAAAGRAGLDTLSLDMMLGLPGQDAASVAASAAACRRLGAAHVSAYLLKVEPGTPFYARREGLDLPGEEETAALYLAACEALEGQGYRQYEISNFALPGRESRHNLKYWNGEPYLGIGPAAHSFLGGRRWYMPRDVEGFLAGNPPLPEDEEDAVIADGSPEEYLMLRLRLTAGLTEEGFRARFGGPIPRRWRERAAALPPGLTEEDETGLRLTREGFLVSNAVIAALLDI